MNLSGHFNLSWRTLVFVLSGLILTWLVLSRSFAAFLADASPQKALWFDSGQPDALVNLAEQAVVTSTAAQLSAASPDQTPEAGEEVSTGRQGISQKVSTYFENLVHAFSRFETVGRNFSISRPVAPDNEATVRAWAEVAVTSEPLNARALRILGQLAEADGDDAEAAELPGCRRKTISCMKIMPTFG